MNYLTPMFFIIFKLKMNFSFCNLFIELIFELRYNN